jgi:hypothetical protein
MSIDKQKEKGVVRGLLWPALSEYYSLSIADDGIVARGLKRSLTAKKLIRPTYSTVVILTKNYWKPYIFTFKAQIYLGEYFYET